MDQMVAATSGDRAKERRNQARKRYMHFREIKDMINGKAVRRHSDEWIWATLEKETFYSINYLKYICNQALEE